MVIFAPISVIIIVYFVISSINYAFNIISLHREEKELKVELAQLKENELDLKNEIEKLKDPDYIARFARENYLYSKNGEYIIKIEGKKESKKSNISKLKKEYLRYAEIGSGLFAILIFIWIISKK